MPAKKTMTTTKVKKKTPSDLETLQGTWHITSLELNGAAPPDVSFEGATVVIRGDTFTSSGMGDPYTGTVEIDASTTPAAFDLVFDSGPQAGIRNLGIYELRGDDWRFCIDMGGVNRPKTFATRPDSGLALETLRRTPASRSGRAAQTKSGTVAPTLPQASRSSASEPRTGEPTEIEGEWAMVSAVFGGKPLADDMVKWCKRVTRGEVTQIFAGPQVMLDASFMLDPSHTPRRIDYQNRSGAKKGQPQAGIYELSDESLRICVAAPGDSRPSEFVSANGDGRSLTIWKRSAGSTSGTAS